MASPATPSASLPSLAPKTAEKSDKSAPTESGSKTAKPSKEKDEDGIGIEELAMPRTMIQRIARSALPPHTQLQKDALLALSKSATLFISHIAGGAQDDLPGSKKTIQPANVFAALEATEFSFMISTLQAELEKFIAIQSNKREEYKKKLKEGKGGPDGSTMLVGDEDSIADGMIQTRGADPAAQLEAESAIDRQRSAKRTKGASGAAVTAGDEDDEDEDIDMIGADTGDVHDDAAEEEEIDDEATESDEESGTEDVQEDRVGTESEDEGEEDDPRTDEDSD